MDIEAIQNLDVDVSEESEVNVDLYASGSPGLSAYEIYLKNGGELTEIDWLASLKGQSGYTPQKGVDYWTDNDIEEIKEYCDTYINSQLGTINTQLSSLTTISEGEDY